MSQQCRTCGNHVTDQFARVCGDNDDVVHHCPECASEGDIVDGAAAIPERKDTRTRQGEPALQGGLSP